MKEQEESCSFSMGGIAVTLEEAYALLGGDAKEAAARLGSRALLVKYLRQFPETGGMAALRAAHEAGDASAMWQAAHSLRGSCKTLELRDLAEAAGQCMAAPEAVWPNLERAYDQAVSVIGLIEDEDDETASTAYAFGGLRALLVEDDHLCAMISSEMLAGMGLSVRVARDGDEAMRLAKLGGFDCVFLDAHIPDTDSVLMLEDIRRALPDAPVFALTAGLLPGEEERLRAAGLRACVGKPADAETIAKLLAECFPKE